jgi:DNA-binding NtrC family response regulator
METLHVLVVSGNESDIETIRGLLETAPGENQHYHVESEEDYKLALKALVSNKYDVYFVDQIVPNSGVSGVDLVHKANAGGCRSAVLLLTNMSDEEIEWFVEECGAAGHINRNLDYEERTLRNAIRTGISHSKDVAEIREQLRELQRQVSGLVHAFDRR